MTIAATFDLFYVPGYCVEVRALGTSNNNKAWQGWSGGIVSGYFNDKEKFVRAVTQLEATGPESIYVTLNPVHDDLLARANNRLLGRKKGAPTTTDEDIAARRWVLLDFDPIRPAGISSTQEEMQAAYLLAVAVANALPHGDPVVALSGNGAHLLYRIDTPNDEESKRSLSVYLKEISQTHSTPKVGIDTSVFNAGRITKLYGTTARKGENTATRPHRRSSIHTMPDEIGTITLAAVPAPAPAPQQVRQGESIERIQSALSVLPSHFGPNSYERWLSVLMAVHSELGDAAIPLLERFGTHEGEIAATCSHFKRGGTTIATLYAIAKDYGWSPIESRPDTERYAEPETVPSAAEIESILSDDTNGLGFSIYQYRPEEGGVLDAFLEHYADNWRFFLATGVWHSWTGTHWQPDQVGSVAVEIQTLLHMMNDEAHGLLARTEAKEEQRILLRYIAATTRSSARVNSIETMIKPHITIDTTPNNKLSLANGTLDLDSFRFTDHDRADGMDYCLSYAYDPAAQCPRFLRFLQEILVFENTTATDKDLILLIQELMGYSLTTDTNRQVMAWLSGEGNNGKSVLISVMQALLGPLAVNLDFQVLGTQGNYDLADLPGKRVAFSTEADSKKTFADGILKRVVSGERIRARHIKQKQFEFSPVAKVWWAMNDKPATRYSHSIWRRLILIPFYRVFSEAEQDVHLLPTLLSELPGILNFALAGLERLNKANRFTTAQAVTAAKDEYALESNPVAQWIEERCEETAIPSTVAGSLYQDYKMWCAVTSHRPLADNGFGRELRRLRIANERRTSGRYYALTVNGKKLSIEIPIGLGL